MIIRPAIQQDRPAIERLWEERQTILAQMDARFAADGGDDLPDDGAFFVAERDGVVGFIACTTREDVGLITDIALDAHAYHGGVARALVDAAARWFTTQPITQIVARVPRYHPVEQAFWRASGAKEWTEARWQTSPQYILMTL